MKREWDAAKGKYLLEQILSFVAKNESVISIQTIEEQQLLRHQFLSNDYSDLDLFSMYGHCILLQSTIIVYNV